MINDSIAHPPPEDKPPTATRAPFDPADPALDLPAYTDCPCPRPGCGCSLRYSRYTREFWCVSQVCRLHLRLSDADYSDLVDLILMDRPVGSYLIILAAGGQPPPPAPLAWLAAIRLRHALCEVAA